jgi:hypothetical protein
MTPQETAEKIRGVLLVLGCPAACGKGAYPMSDESWWVTAGEGTLEEPVFYAGPEGVTFLSVRSSVGTLPRRAAAPLDWVKIAARCDAVADLNRAREQRKKANAEAWAVADGLRELGMTATMSEGRVRITLDFSPEYAREMGPKIAEMLGERKWLDLHRS